MFCGILIGIFASVVARFNRAMGKEPITETFIILFFGYTSHIIVEAFGFSGILSAFVCG